MAQTKTVYIKGETNTEVCERNVRLEDILSIECSDRTLENQIKKITVLTIPQKGQHRFVVSVLRIIECIHREFPDVEVQNEGEKDLIITYEADQVQNWILQLGKVAIVSGITFLGAAFSIMSFNNDVSVTKLFGQIYELFMGQPSDGFTVIEFTYSIGLIIGILVFFNHFGKKRFSVDPTPMEVEMRTYEKDIESTLVDIYSRKEKEIDVGQTGTSGNSGA